VAALRSPRWALAPLDLGELLTLDSLKASRDALAGAGAGAAARHGRVFFAVYVLATALSIPGAVILTLAAGAMFGLGWGLLSCPSRPASAHCWPSWWRATCCAMGAGPLRQAAGADQRGHARDGTFYLLTLRLVPVFPFWLINLLMGLTPIGAGRFYWVSQLGMLAGTLVYVNAGTQLAAIESPGDILSPGAAGQLRAAGHVPADRQGGRRLACSGARSTRSGPSPRASTATWSSSAPAPAGWSRPTSPPP
jgi:hypothetical protein